MSHKIVVLDGAYANLGDLSWEPLSNLAPTTIHERTPQELVIERSQDATVLIINKVKIGKAEFDALDKLELIVISATGMDNVDLEEAKKRKIPVCNVSDYSTQSVAQHTFALILELTNRVGDHSITVKNNEWSKDKGFSYVLHSMPELSQLTLGVYGFGAIGKAVAKIGHGFGMNVQIVSKHTNPSDYSQYRFVSEQTMFTESDVVSLHCPLTTHNQEFVNNSLLQTMKKNALLINTARGKLINETDLYQALSSQMISGAALDVLAQEPPQTSHPLFGLGNCIITPHMAWTSLKSRKELIDKVVAHVANHLDHKK